MYIINSSNKEFMVKITCSINRDFEGKHNLVNTMLFILFIHFLVQPIPFSDLQRHKSHVWVQVIQWSLLYTGWISGMVVLLLKKQNLEYSFFSYYVWPDATTGIMEKLGSGILLCFHYHQVYNENFFEIYFLSNRTASFYRSYRKRIQVVLMIL